MKTFLALLVFLCATVGYAGNEGGGGPRFVPEDTESEAVLFGGVKGDEVEVNFGKFDSTNGWKVKAHLISFKDLQQLDVKIGNALNESARTQSWVGLTK